MKTSYFKKKHMFFLISSAFALLCIFFADLSKMYFLEHIRQAPKSSSYINLYVLLSMILFPCIAFFSDVWCRKKILLFSLLSLCISVFFLYKKQFLLSTLFFTLSPVTSVARAAYCDVHITNKREPNIVDTFLIQPLPWILAPIIFTQQTSFFRTTLSLGIILFVISHFFKDKIDRQFNKSHFGIGEALRKYGVKASLIIIISFALSNTAWSMLFYRLEDSKKVLEISKYFSLAPGIAFLAGAFFARLIIRRKKIFFLPLNDRSKKAAETDDYYKLLIFVSLGLVPFFSFVVFLNWILNDYEGNIVFSLLPGFTLLGGVFIPAIYSFFGSRIGYHSLGVVYATIEVIQSLAEYSGANLEEINIFKPSFNLALIVIFLTFLSLIGINLLTVGKYHRNHEVSFE